MPIRVGPIVKFRTKWPIVYTIYNNVIKRKTVFLNVYNDYVGLFKD